MSDISLKNIWILKQLFMANMFQVKDNYRNVNVTLTQTRKQEKKELLSYYWHKNWCLCVMTMKSEFEKRESLINE